MSFLCILFIQSGSIASSPFCNYHGKIIRAITSIDVPYMIVNEDYKNIYNGKGQTYDITSSTSGLLVDVIKSVATICNFTLEIHLREDQLSGKINEFTNGSLSYTGVFENLMDTKGTYLYQKESYELQSRIFLTFLVFLYI